jgi:tape measure domain-containing protein
MPVVPAGDIVARYRIEIRDAESALLRMNALAKQSALNQRNSFGEITRSVDKFSNALFALGAAQVGLGIKAAALAARFEQVNMAFTVMTKGAEQAKVMLKELADFSVRAGQQFFATAQNAQMLINAGFKLSEIKKVMTAISGAAIASGRGDEGFMRIALAISQMQAKGRMMGEEMTKQLGELMPAWDILAQKVGKTKGELLSLAYAGKLYSSEMLPALISGMAERYGGLVDQMGNTLLGKWNALMTKLQLMASKGGFVEFGKKVVDTLSKVIDWFSKFDASMYVTAIRLTFTIAAFAKLIQWVQKLKEMRLTDLQLKAFASGGTPQEINARNRSLQAIMRQNEAGEQLARGDQQRAVRIAEAATVEATAWETAEQRRARASEEAANRIAYAQTRTVAAMAQRQTALAEASGVLGLSSTQRTDRMTEIQRRLRPYAGLHAIHGADRVFPNEQALRQEQFVLTAMRDQEARAAQQAATVQRMAAESQATSAANASARAGMARLAEVETATRTRVAALAAEQAQLQRNIATEQERMFALRQSALAEKEAAAGSQQRAASLAAATGSLERYNFAERVAIQSGTASALPLNNRGQFAGPAGYAAGAAGAGIGGALMGAFNIAMWVAFAVMILDAIIEPIAQKAEDRMRQRYFDRMGAIDEKGKLAATTKRAQDHGMKYGEALRKAMDEGFTKGSASAQQKRIGVDAYLDTLDRRTNITENVSDVFRREMEKRSLDYRKDVAARARLESEAQYNVQLLQAQISGGVIAGAGGIPSVGFTAATGDARKELERRLRDAQLELQGAQKIADIEKQKNDVVERAIKDADAAARAEAEAAANRGYENTLKANATMRTSREAQATAIITENKKIIAREKERFASVMQFENFMARQDRWGATREQGLQKFGITEQDVKDVHDVRRYAKVPIGKSIRDASDYAQYSAATIEAKKAIADQQDIIRGNKNKNIESLEVQEAEANASAKQAQKDALEQAKHIVDEEKRRQFIAERTAEIESEQADYLVEIAKIKAQNLAKDADQARKDEEQARRDAAQINVEAIRSTLISEQNKLLQEQAVIRQRMGWTDDSVERLRLGNESNLLALRMENERKVADYRIQLELYVANIEDERERRNAAARANYAIAARQAALALQVAQQQQANEAAERAARIEQTRIDAARTAETARLAAQFDAADALLSIDEKRAELARTAGRDQQIRIEGEISQQEIRMVWAEKIANYEMVMAEQIANLRAEGRTREADIVQSNTDRERRKAQSMEATQLAEHRKVAQAKLDAAALDTARFRAGRGATNRAYSTEETLRAARAGMLDTFFPAAGGMFGNAAALEQLGKERERAKRENREDFERATTRRDEKGNIVQLMDVHGDAYKALKIQSDEALKDALAAIDNKEINLRVKMAEDSLNRLRNQFRDFWEEFGFGGQFTMESDYRWRHGQIPGKGLMPQDIGKALSWLPTIDDLLGSSKTGIPLGTLPGPAGSASVPTVRILVEEGPQFATRVEVITEGKVEALVEQSASTAGRRM